MPDNNPTPPTDVVSRGLQWGHAETDKELICNWMETRPDLPDYYSAYMVSPNGWWILCATYGGGMRWFAKDLGLDRLHLVEDCLSDKQWLHYGVCCWKWYTEAATTNDYEISHLSRWRRVLMHLSAAQKIQALATGLRSVPDAR